MENINCKIVKHNSPEYWESIDLREKVLRIPLGLKFSKEELAAEDKEIHCCAFVDGKIQASLSLVILNDERIKVRQVCTSSELQGSGIGKKLAQFSESWAKENGYKIFECNARSVAVKFYEKMDYKIVSDKFTEVGIDHFKMEKILK